MIRASSKPVARLFLDRWSPRAFDGSRMLEEDLLTMLEAARWAPSAFNYQPWLFLYAHRGDENWQRFLDLLIPFNRSWAEGASVLLYILSDTRFGAPDKISHSHSFDAGAAWAQLALQASLSGYHAHGMTGIDFERIYSDLGIPAAYRVEAAVAIGRLGDPASLPQGLRDREKPSDRKPLSEIAVAGPFPKT